MKLSDKSRILITCARGLGECLAEEISSFGYAIIEQRSNGVEIEGDWHDVMKLNLELRTAFAVLYRVMKFEAKSANKFYQMIKSYNWEDIIDSSEYISIVSWADTPCINNTMYVNQRAKDAIVDRILEKSGKRPDSGSRNTNVVINIYWNDKDCWVYINTSGKKLADRGYRKIPCKAPLQETLAAAILKSTGYDGSVPLILPMCGSGTLAIEGALIALKRGPALLRSNFGFMHLKFFDSEIWSGIRLKANKKSDKMLPNRIIATDIDLDTVEAARKNAKTAGVDHLIDFDVCDFADTFITEQGGIIVMNPEYGERLGEIKSLEKLYARIGDFFKQKCQGFNCFVFSGNMDLIKKIGLKTSQRKILYNAHIECRLLKYEIYAGSRKSKYMND